MKNKFMLRLACIFLIGMLVLSGCGPTSEPKETNDNDTSEQSTDTETTENDTPTDTGNTDNTNDTGNTGDNSDSQNPDTDTPEDTTETLSFFTSVVTDTDRLIQEALEQYNAGDYTPLSEPVKYNVLWLGFTHVKYNELDFQMTDFDREYLEAVALNYEKSLESITNHNLDITVELHFVDDVTSLTKWYDDDWLYLAQETVQPVIDKYTAGHDFDTVLTTVQTAGDENYLRNESKEGFGINGVMLGLCTAGMNSPMGYSTFDLQKPYEGTYPLEDPEIPSLYATSVAVHEWMHQLEYMGTLLGIEYPNTHAYFGSESFPGYQKYNNGENDYDYFEFYKLVLQGKLPYTGNGDVEYVGMYPKMWPLIKRNIFNLGKFTIKAADGTGYLNGREEEPRLIVSDAPCVWNIKYIGDGKFTFTPENMPDKLIDLGNAWDLEDNTISLWIYTGYVDAQSWRAVDNIDGSYSLQTPYESGRLLTIREELGALLCTDGTAGTQDWFIEPIS